VSSKKEMKPLLILINAFVISLIVNKVFNGNYEFALSGRIAISAMLLFTAIGHFVFTKGMSMLWPDFIPFRIEIVYMAGIIEIAAAIGLFIPDLKIVTAWLLLLFFILMLPANIYASIKHIDYQQGTSGGNGPIYLWFRVPLQALFIAWTYFSAIKY